jgi:hypothetical protein
VSLPLCEGDHAGDGTALDQLLFMDHGKLYGSRLEVALDVAFCW